MKKLGLFLIVFIWTAFPQQKYWIYFADKGTTNEALSPGSEVYNSALAKLSSRSIERRKKVMGGQLITFEDLPLKQAYLDSLEQMQVKIINHVKWLNAVSAFLTSKQIETLQKVPYVSKIEIVRTFIDRNPELAETLSKPQFDSLYYGESFQQLRMCDIPIVQDFHITGKGVLMGILDTGFKWRTHEAFQGVNVIAEYDFIFNDDITENQTGDNPGQHNHGTSVFSVIAGRKENELIGASYDASFLLAKTEDIRSETRVEEDNYAAALEWMENLGVDITTSSLGYDQFDDFSYSYSDMNGKTTIVTKAAEWIFSRGVLVLSAAGNEGDKKFHYISAPSDGFNVICVGAVTRNNNVTAFSSRGPSSDGRIKPDVVALGESVECASAFSDVSYTKSSGTSLSTPIAAGCAALLLSAHPWLTNVQMRDIIIRTAGNSTYPDNDRGYGLISAKNAIEYPNIGADRTRSPLTLYSINKTFLNDSIDAVDIFLSNDGKQFTRYHTIKTTVNYTFLIPQSYENQILKFYFKYDLQNGDSVRVPSENTYTFTYGDYLVNEINSINPDYVLSSNFPNPFNNSTRINFLASEQAHADLIIYDALGQKVRTLYSSDVTPGEYSVIWNGKSDSGIICSSGMYIYRITIGSSELSKKMIFLK